MILKTMTFFRAETHANFLVILNEHRTIRLVLTISVATSQLSAHKTQTATIDSGAQTREETYLARDYCANSMV